MSHESFNNQVGYIREHNNYILSVQFLMNQLLDGSDPNVPFIQKCNEILTESRQMSQRVQNEELRINELFDDANLSLMDIHLYISKCSTEPRITILSYQMAYLLGFLQRELKHEIPRVDDKDDRTVQQLLDDIRSFVGNMRTVDARENGYLADSFRN